VKPFCSALHLLLVSFTTRIASMSTSIKWISSLAAAAAVSVVSLPSVAAESGTGSSTTVRAWDLDLTKPRDVQTLYDRVTSAAERICQREAHDHYTSTRHWAPSGWIENCVSQAVDSAVRNAGDPLLAALHVRSGVARRD
jgi:UrcA family protein